MLPQPTCTGQQYSVMNGVVSGSESATEGSSHGIVPALMVKLAEARLAHDPVAKAHATDLGRLREVRAANTQVLAEAFEYDDGPIRLSAQLMAAQKWTSSHRQLTNDAVDVACNRMRRLLEKGGSSLQMAELLAELEEALKDHTERSGSVCSIQIIEVGPQHQGLPVTQKNYLAEVGAELETTRRKIQAAEERRRASCGELARAVADCKAQLRDALITGCHESLSAEVLDTRLQASLHLPPAKRERHTVAWLRSTLAELARKQHPGDSAPQCSALEVVEFMRRELKQRLNEHARAPPAKKTLKRQPLSWEDPAALRLRFRMVRRGCA